jgi:adenylate kinase
MTDINTIFFLGKPGSGKGTQAQMFADKMGYTVLSSGENFRQMMNRNDSLGKRVKEFYDTGGLFPHWFPFYFTMTKILDMPLENGVVLEGSARTIDETQLLDEALDWLGRDYLAFDLEISDGEATQRMKSRQRGDVLSEEDKIRVRLAEYRNKTVPVLDFFREKGRLIEVNGERSIDDVHKEILEKFSNHTK